MYNRVYGPYKQDDGYRIELRQDDKVVKVFTPKDWTEAVALGKSYRSALRAESNNQKQKGARKGKPYMDLRAWLALLWKRSVEAESRADAEILRSLAAAIREARSAIMLAAPGEPGKMGADSPTAPPAEDLRNMPQDELEKLAKQHLRVVAG